MFVDRVDRLKKIEGRRTVAEVMGILPISKASREEFERIFDHQRPKLCRWLSRKYPQLDAEDVIQETFVTSWENRAEFQGRSGFSTWIFAIAEYKAMTAQRRQKRFHTIEYETLPISDSSSSEEITSDTKLELQFALNYLEESEQRLLTQYFQYGLTLHEIAEADKLNLSTVKYRFYKALRTLKGVMTEDGNK